MGGRSIEASHVRSGVDRELLRVRSSLHPMRHARTEVTP
jgi:hypothetical protein